MTINRMKHFGVLCVALLPTYVMAESKFQHLIPHGWNLLDSAQSDLNKDRLSDLALIIEKNNPKNIQKDSDDRSINLNPRHLLIFFKPKQCLSAYFTKSETTN